VTAKADPTAQDGSDQGGDCEGDPDSCTNNKTEEPLTCSSPLIEAALDERDLDWFRDEALAFVEEAADGAPEEAGYDQGHRDFYAAFEDGDWEVVRQAIRAITADYEGSLADHIRADMPQTGGDDTQDDATTESCEENCE